MKKIVICALALLGSLMIFSAIHADYQPSAGDVIKVDDKTKPALYLINSQNQRQLFPNAVTFWTWYSGDWSNIKDSNNSKITLKYISQADFDQLASGKNVVAKANSKLIKFDNSGNVYAVADNGVINKVAGSNDDSVAKALYGNDYKSQIITIQNGFQSNYTEGQPLAADSVVTPIDTVLPPRIAADTSCTIPTDTSHMDIFDSHVHNTSKISLSQIISEMDKAGVSMANVYSGTLENSAQYPGRFINFVDTPDSPQASEWLMQGQSFVTSAETKLKTGKYYGIGEANLRYYGSATIPVPPPNIYVPADTSIWLQLVDLAAKYNVPISFHFVPDDATTNVAFEKMLSHNKDATLIWAHLGFNNMALDSAALNDYLLRYPHLYFDTAGIQGMHNPTDGSPAAKNSAVNWERMMPNGQLSAEWKRFFETWNSRILVATDAGGGQNSLERWLNYSGNVSKSAPDDNIGHWRSLFSYVDSNSARNILSSNSRALFLKEAKPAYTYSVSSGGKCYSISVSSGSSVSALTFDSSSHTINFTVADSNGTVGNAVITIPNTLAGKSFTATVDGQTVTTQTVSNSVNTTITAGYAGGIREVTLSAH